MTTGQEIPASLYCPRCGGPMYKPAGSPFFWHANNNHSPCSITNIAELPKIASDDDLPEPPGEQMKNRRGF